MMLILSLLTRFLLATRSAAVYSYGFTAALNTTFKFFDEVVLSLLWVAMHRLCLFVGLSYFCSIIAVSLFVDRQLLESNRSRGNIGPTGYCYLSSSEIDSIYSCWLAAEWYERWCRCSFLPIWSSSNPIATLSDRRSRLRGKCPKSKTSSWLWCSNCFFFESGGGVYRGAYSCSSDFYPI